jgi:glycosyltransferase involved in cell wall biosynthesis
MARAQTPSGTSGDLARPVAWLLTPVAPDPTGTGLGLRAWAWLSTLSRSHQVRVLVVAPESAVPGAPGDWVFAGPQVAYTRRGWLLLGWCLPWLARLTRAVVMDWRHRRPPPGLVPAWPPEAGAERVERIVAFRICVHEFARAAARRFPQARLEIDLDDLESDTRFSLARAQLRLLRWGQALRTASVAWQYRSLEAPVLRHCDQVWLAAPEDVPVLRARLPGGPTIGCLPNRLQAPAPSPGPPPPDGPFELLFVGSLNYLPNEEGVLWLLRRVLPRLRRTLPTGWRLTVVGRHASPALARRLRSEPGVEFWPDAASLHDAYARAHVALVPLHSGGGTKLKALEAFAWRRPVVTTPHGARGLGVSDGVHCLVAERASDFADRLLWLRDRPARGAQLADAAWARFDQAFRLPQDRPGAR